MDRTIEEGKPMNKSRNNGRSDEQIGGGADSDKITRPDLGDQLKGAAIGALIALALSYGAQQLGIIQGNLIRHSLWGAALGGLLAGADQLAKAGSRLTKRDEKWLNVLVAVIGFLAIFGVMVGVVALASWIVNILFRPALSPMI